MSQSSLSGDISWIAKNILHQKYIAINISFYVFLNSQSITIFIFPLRVLKQYKKNTYLTHTFADMTTALRSISNLEIVEHYCTIEHPSKQCQCLESRCSHVKAAEMSVGVTYRCQCGTVRSIKGGGLTNILSHIKAAHKDHVLTVRAAKGPSSQTLVNTFYTDKSRAIFQWLRFMVRNYLPLSYLDDKENQRIHSLQPISAKTFKKYALEVVQKVERRIAAVLPDKFGIVIDGWSQGSTHYVAIFAAFEESGELVMPLLAMTPPFDETHFDAQAHYDLIGDTLELYGKSTYNIAYMVADNAAVNVKTAGDELLNVPFVGCASHKWNLAMQAFMKSHEGDLQVRSPRLRYKWTLTQRQFGQSRRHRLSMNWWTFCPVSKLRESCVKKPVYVP